MSRWIKKTDKPEVLNRRRKRRGTAGLFRRVINWLYSQTFLEAILIIRLQTSVQNINMKRLTEVSSVHFIAVDAGRGISLQKVLAYYKAYGRVNCAYSVSMFSDFMF